MFGPLFDRIALCSTVRKRVETIGREQVKEGGNLFYFRGAARNRGKGRTCNGAKPS